MLPVSHPPRATQRRGRRARDRAAKPFEIMEAMADEIAQHAAAVLAIRLPALEPQARRLVFDVPGHDDVAQSPDRAVVQHRLGSPPSRQLGKIEIDHRRPAAAFAPLRASPRRRRGRRRSAFPRTPACRDRARAARSRAAAAGGTAIATASTAGPRPVRAQSPMPRATFAARASSAVRAASVPASATTSQRGSVRKAGSSTVRP